MDSAKVYCASKISKRKIEVDFVKPTDKRFFTSITNTLPLLQVKEDTNLFSSNTIVKFLLSSESVSKCQLTKEDEISEYEISFIRPLVSRVVAEAGDKTDHLLQDQLDSVFEHTKSLITSELTSDSIILWFSLYPILYQACPFRNYLLDQHKVVAGWFEALRENHFIIETISQVLPDQTWNSFCKQMSQINLQCNLSAIIPSSDHHHPSTLSHHHHPSTHSHHHQPSTHSIKSTKNPQTKIPTEESTTPTTTKSITNDDMKRVDEAFVVVGDALLKKQRTKPLLPEPKERNILVTSALPYVNNVPHLGNIIGCVLSADVYVRYCRLKDYNVLYICGTDEYGTATETKALQEKLTPMEICDKYNKLHTEIYEWFNIGFDKFGRTTNQHQCKIAQDIFMDLHNNQYICKNTVEQLLCQQCDKFLADRLVEGECPFCSYPDARGDQCDKCGKLINAVELKTPRCKLCSSTPCVRQSKHLFLDLPKLEPRLVKHLDKAMEKGVWSTNARTITKSWIRDGLKPRCVSRDLKWGTPVPLEGYTDKVFYVWYDAPIGYISITADYTTEWKQWWQNPEHVQLYNFMAKDNVAFHSVIFPSTLLGTNQQWTLLNHLCSTEYLNYEDSKFSKSRGVGVFGNNAAEAGLPADVFRFYLLFIRPESQDTVFSWDDLTLKNNSELLNNLGNFVNRALTFVKNNFNGEIQKIDLNKEDKEFLVGVTNELNNYTSMMEQVRLRDGLRSILSISSLGNQYIQANKPWVLIKGDAVEKARAGSITSLAANVVCLVSVLLHPFMPTTCVALLTQLKHTKALDYKLTDHVVLYLKSGHVIGEVKPPFQKIEAEVTEALKKKFAGKQEKEEVVVKEGEMSEAQLGASIEIQGIKVRELKMAKADKETVTTEVQVLLGLKAALNKLTGGPVDPPKPAKPANKKKPKK